VSGNTPERAELAINAALLAVSAEGDREPKTPNSALEAFAAGRGARLERFESPLSHDAVKARYAAYKAGAAVAPVAKRALVAHVAAEEIAAVDTDVEANAENAVPRSPLQPASPNGECIRVHACYRTCTTCAGTSLTSRDLAPPPSSHSAECCCDARDEEAQGGDAPARKARRAPPLDPREPRR
jgi:hypothetical protein